MPIKKNILSSSNWFNPIPLRAPPKEYLELEELLTRIEHFIAKLLINKKALSKTNDASSAKLDKILEDSNALKQDTEEAMDKIDNLTDPNVLRQQISKKQAQGKSEQRHIKKQWEFSRKNSHEDDGLYGNSRKTQRELDDEIDDQYEGRDEYERSNIGDRLEQLQQKLKSTIAKLEKFTSPIKELENNLNNLLIYSFELQLADILEETGISTITDDQVNPYWYSEDNIHDLLRHLLPNENLYYISAQTQFENSSQLQDSLNQAISSIIGSETIALMPLHLHGNHWIGIMIRQQQDGDIQVIIINPTGESIESEANMPLLVETITDLVTQLSPTSDVDFIDLTLTQQYNGIDCGAFTVDNLVRLANAAPLLDYLNREEIITTANLQWSENAGASIRAMHSQLSEQYIMSHHDISHAALIIDNLTNKDVTNTTNAKNQTLNNEELENIQSLFAEHEIPMMISGEIPPFIFGNS